MVDAETGIPCERRSRAHRLNYGDCFSYALAKTTGEPLLFKGKDFAKTDLIAAQ
jgi:ribonuclease VapC